MLQDKGLGSVYRKFFFNEVALLGRLTHPNIVMLYDAGISDQYYYLSMEYVNGYSLYQYTRKGETLSFHRVLRIIYDCANALGYAHRYGVIHRDIKPGNILVTDSQKVKLSDFGIAFRESTDGRRIEAGTPRYMSPEQLQKGEEGPQSDLFSLGLVMYELLVGKHPFESEHKAAQENGDTGKNGDADKNDDVVLDRIVCSEPDPIPTELQIPRVVERIVMRLLMSEPEKRFDSAESLCKEIAPLLVKKDSVRIVKKDLEGKIELLEKSRFFKPFSEAERREIAQHGQYISVREQHIFFREGTRTEKFYVIFSGKVGIMKEDILISSLREGSSFGEMGFLNNAPRTASAIALACTEAWEMDIKTMSKLSTVCQVRFLKIFNKVLFRRLSRATRMIAQHRIRMLQ